MQLPIVVALLLMSFSGSILHAQYYPVDPRNPYVAPQRKPATYRSARDYWKAKREALSQGRRKFRSAAELANDKLVRDSAATDKDKKTVATKSGLPTPTGDLTAATITAAPPSVATTGETTAPAGTSPGSTERGTRRSTIDYGDFERLSCKRILRRIIGAPRSENGASPEDGFSPSGLLRYVFSSIGYEVPEGDAELLWNKLGIHLGTNYGDFKPGDILFYRLYSKSEQRGKLFLAICLDEEEMVYPSYTRNKVVSRSYRERFWRQRFVGAKRVFLN